MDTETGGTRKQQTRSAQLMLMYRLVRRYVRRRRRRLRAAAAILSVALLCWFSLRHRVKPGPQAHSVMISKVSLQPWGPPGIVLHDSDSPAQYHGVALNAERLEDIHAREHPGWATACSDGKIYHIGYHYVILPSGKIERGRPENCLGMHARTYNDWIGICVIGAFQTNRHWWPERPTNAQMKSIVKLCEYLMSKYHIPPELVKRHRDINNTYCPGDRFPYFKILASLEAYSATHAETRPIPGRVVSLVIPGRHSRRTYPAILGKPLQMH